jgi:hypothetical protein
MSRGAILLVVSSHLLALALVAPHWQAQLPIDALDLLVFDRNLFASQQHMQESIAEPLMLPRKFKQPLAQSAVITAPLIPTDRSGAFISQQARRTLAGYTPPAGTVLPIVSLRTGVPSDRS